MPAFRSVLGATGQAQTTSWFGSAIPDRGFTLTTPGYYNSPTNAVIYVTDRKPAYLIQDHVPFNTAMGGGANADTIALGAAVTAPDGTSTANHIAETTVNGFHAMTSVFSDGGVAHYRRIAVIAQAAERTRMFVAICLKPIVNESGCRTVFDLAGGQIGVVNTRYGTDTSQGSNIFWIPISQSIKALGNGWFLCIMDIQTSVNITGHSLSVLIGPDAGSGTQAVDISYLGDGTSGINVWKASVLPPRTWAMQNTIFSNDMNDLTKFDVNNTLAPGFDFYMNWSDFPLNGGGVAPANSVSVSNSIVTINVPRSNPAPPLASVGYTGGTGYVGKGWLPPALIESGFAFETFRAPQSNGMGFFGHGIETLLTSSTAEFHPPVANTITYSEIDFAEVQSAAGGLLGVLSVFGDPTTPSWNATNIQSTRSGSYGAWNAFTTYHINAKVGLTSTQQLYISLTDPNTGNQPDLTLGVDWDIFTPPAGQPTAANTFIYDAQAQNTYSVLWIPDLSMYDPHDVGELIGFINGHIAIRFLTGSVCVLSYALSQSFPRPFTGARLETGFRSLDLQPMVFTIGAPIFSQLYLDFARVTQ